MFLIPRDLHFLFKRQREEERALPVHWVGDSSEADSIAATDDQTASQEFDIFPADPIFREAWFSLTRREREVLALVRMGYPNDEVAAILSIGRQTVMTHLQHIFKKFGLRSKKELQAALASWPAEEWWNLHHN